MIPNPTTGTIPRQNYNSKRYMYFFVLSSTVHNNQNMGTTKCPSNEWIKEIWYRYTMKYYSAIRKKQAVPFAATGMQLEIIILSEVSQEKTYHMMSLLGGI